MAAVAFMIGSIPAFLAGVIAFAFTGAGFGLALLIYLGGSFAGSALLLTASLCLHRVTPRADPAPQTS